MNNRINKGYHVTTESALPSILKQGIVPAIGPRSLLLGETQPAIYLFSKDTEVEDGLVNWINNAFSEEETLYVLECNLEGLDITSQENQFELVCRQTIAPSLITKVYTEDLDKYMQFDHDKREHVLV